MKMRGGLVRAVFCLVYGVAVCSCSRPERRWWCSQDVATQKYGCEQVDEYASIKLEGRELSIEYDCMSAPQVEFSDPEDMFCTPQVSQGGDFDDGTVPRFHCYGNEQPRPGEITYSCQPYWMWEPAARRQGGAGWFLWLALQSHGFERDQRFAIAKKFRDVTMVKFQRWIAQITPPASPAPDETPNREEEEKAERYLRQELQHEDDVVKRHNERTPTEIKADVAAELKAWQEMK